MTRSTSCVRSGHVTNVGTLCPIIRVQSVAVSSWSTRYGSQRSLARGSTRSTRSAWVSGRAASAGTVALVLLRGAISKPPLQPCRPHWRQPRPLVVPRPRADQRTSAPRRRLYLSGRPWQDSGHLEGCSVSVRPSHLDGRCASDVGDQVAGAQRCGSNSSMRLAGCVGSRSSTSLRYA